MAKCQNDNAPGTGLHITIASRLKTKINRHDSEASSKTKVLTYKDSGDCGLAFFRIEI